MVNVLLLGGTGFIGSRAGWALRGNSHRVFAIVRSQEKATKVQQEELTPIIGEADDLDLIEKTIKDQYIHVVLDCTPVTTIPELVERLKKVSKERIEYGQSSGVDVPSRLGYVYISGTWLYGSSTKPSSDLEAIGVDPERPLPDLIKPRVGWENVVLNSRDLLDVAIVRAGLVYGYESPAAGALFGGIVQAKRSGADHVDITTPRDNLTATVHVDDIATGITATVEKLQLINTSSVFPSFTFVSYSEPTDLIQRKVADYIGYNGTINFGTPTDNLFYKALNTQYRGHSERAHSLLGWQPKRRPLLEEIEVHVDGWIAGEKAITLFSN